MNIIIFTQKEPFYLKNNLEYFINNLPNNIKIKGIILSDVSPFGKKESFFRKAIKTYQIFGMNFFIYYSLKYIKNIFLQESIYKLIKRKKIKIINLSDSINSKTSIKKIGSFNPDIIVSILGNQIFRKDILSLPRIGCINLHTALLPKYRGLMPSFWVMKNNEKETGVSVFFMDEGIDNGPIIVQIKIKIENHYTQEDLIRITKKIGMKALIQALVLIKNDEVKLIKNDFSKRSYFSFPKKEDVKIFNQLNKKFY